jgi:hypothetical protein
VNWSVLVYVLVQVFGPFLEKRLEDLFKRAQDLLEEGQEKPGEDTRTAIRTLFTAARGELWFWQRGRLRLLGACEKVALARADEIAGAVNGYAIPKLGLSEQVELAKAL